ncbi:MAG: TRAP transporter small permease subunit [Betaproteobacteria bacterium]|nr:TRAP transporter small permease subunit [Betaproteobacteria bacterium]
MKPFVRAVDALSRACGAIAALLVIALMVLMLYDVAMRYLANAPTLWAFDVNTYLMGSAFVLSIAYGLSHDSHVRVDLLYTSRTRPRLAWVDLIGFSLLALPVLAWITAGLWTYFAEAYESGERSGSSAWNPVLWPFRFVLFAGFLILTVQVLAEILRRIVRIRGGHAAAPSPGHR